jgi:hypothetical protein
MKKVSITVLITIGVLSLSACGGSNDGATGAMFEKMAIFSLISLTIFSIFIISFGGSRQKRSRSQGKSDHIQNGSIYPLSSLDLTSYPVYVWDYRSSFHKIVFHPDGVLLKSSSVTKNGVDPTVKAVGNWSLSSDGKVMGSFNAAGITKKYTRISKNNLMALMKPDFGIVEAWYFGANGLANIQISIFGNSASIPPTTKFTDAQVSGRTFLWATYPCVLVTSSGEVAVNREATYGAITFSEKGVLTKSIDNKIGSTPDYTPLISGTWSVDDKSGILTTTASGFPMTASILFQDLENCQLLISTAVENRLWFTDPASAPEKLAAYISEGCTLIREY